MTAPLISVVVPAYNAAHLLARALDSIALQDPAPAEVIVVDDGSDDDTAAVAQAYAKLPVCLVRHPRNLGGAAALHTGIEAAANELVAFLDADDEWLPGKLAAQIAALKAVPDATVVATGFIYISPNGSEQASYGLAPFPHEGRQFWRNLLGDSAILQSSALVRRSLVLGTGGIDRSLRTGYDQQLFVRLAMIGPVAYVHAPFVRYHDTPGSLTKVPDPDNVLRVLALTQRHIDSFAHHLTPAERRAFTAARNTEAAVGLIAARAWGPAIRCTLKGMAVPGRRAESLWRLVTNAAPARALKQTLRRRLS